MPDNHNEDDDGAHPHVDDGPAGAAGGAREKNKRRRKRADGGAEFAKKGLHHEKYNLFDVLDFKYKKVSDTMVRKLKYGSESTRHQTARLLPLTLHKRQER